MSEFNSYWYYSYVIVEDNTISPGYGVGIVENDVVFDIYEAIRFTAELRECKPHNVIFTGVFEVNKNQYYKLLDLCIEFN